MADQRKTSSITRAFEELLEGAGSPPIYTSWTALWMISSAVERNVWTFTRGQPLYPNLYLLYAAPSGGGKSITLDVAGDIITRTFHAIPKQRRLAYENMTGPAMVDVIRDKDTNIRLAINPNSRKPEEYGGLSILISDLQTLLSEYDKGLVATLTRLYDCKRYSEGRRTSKDNTFELERTYLTMIAGTPPDQLMTTVPEAAWSWGLMPRFIIIGAPASKPDDLFANKNAQLMHKLELNIGEDLLWLAKNAKGQVNFDPEAKQLMQEFHEYGDKNQGGPPIPTHPRLAHYNTRRVGHMLKIIQNAVLDEYQGGPLLAKAEHYHRAFDMLTTAEATVPEVFKSAGAQGDMPIVVEIHSRCQLAYARRGKPIKHSQLHKLVCQYVQTWRAEQMIESMTKQGLLKKAVHEFENAYIPRTDDPFDEL